jgi:hypothetical protein
MNELGYTKSLVAFFIIPFVLLAGSIFRSVERKPFVLSIGTVCVLGWAWSLFLSYKKWWIFPGKDIVGLYVFPHLPLEEFVIYPIGGALAIYLYLRVASRFQATPRPGSFWALLLGTTAIFGAIALCTDARPFYLYSQLLVYNGLCLALAPFTSKSLKFAGLVASIAILGSIGFLWDFLAFTFQWWTYTAITGLRIGPVPIEDINFYLLAPTAAISLYVFFCRYFPSSSLSSNRL